MWLQLLLLLPMAMHRSCRICLHDGGKLRHRLYEPFPPHLACCVCVLTAPPTGHQEAAEPSVLEAQARGVPGALLERCRLLWERDKGHRAMLELQLALQQQLEGGVFRVGWRGVLAEGSRVCCVTPASGVMAPHNFTIGCCKRQPPTRQPPD